MEQKILPFRPFTTVLTLASGARLFRKFRTRSIRSLSMSNTILTVSIPWHVFSSGSATTNIISPLHFIIDSCNCTVITTCSILIQSKQFNQIKVSSTNTKFKYKSQSNLKYTTYEDH